MKDKKEIMHTLRKLHEAGDSNYIGKYIPGTVQLGDTQSYPLAGKVKMPDWHEYESGLLRFRFEDIRCDGIDSLDTDPTAIDVRDTTVRMSFKLGDLHLQGNYTLDARHDPKLDMDTAGNLHDLPAAGTPLPAGEDILGGTLSPETQEKYKAQANKEKSNLKDPNSQKLMTVYNEHNEQYNNAFLSNSELRKYWKGKGATAQMADHTSKALEDENRKSMPINSDEQKYPGYMGGKISYNENAFQQQLNVAVATVMLDKDFDPYGEQPPNPDTASFKAALATLNFKKAVNTTGNDKDKTAPMTADKVTQSVGVHSGEMPTSKPAELNASIMQGMGGGGSDEGNGPGGDVLEEEERRRVRFIIESAMRQRAAEAADTARPLWSGNCNASIRNAEANIELTVAKENGKLQVQSIQSDVQLPAFDIDIDDSQWQGEAGTIARKRLSKAYFIRSLLHNHITDKLRDIFSAAVGKALAGAVG
ncbi:MAG: hypothetical protein GY765_35775 [bacterium]|nr:hypothetical protein [bacterium]